MRRRAFLRLAGGLGLAGVLPGCRLREPPAAGDPSVADVIVIGAGISGLAAAGALVGRGLRVIVIEARARLGGRLLTDTTLGVPIDLGAAWIHGDADNPLVGLARGCGMRTVETDWYALEVRDPAGERIEPAAAFRAGALLGRLRADGGDEDRSLGAALRTEMSWLSPPDRRLLAWQAAVEAIDFGDDLARISLRYGREDEEFNGEDVQPIGGYAGLVACLARGLDVRLGVRALTVEDRGGAVRVATSDGVLAAERAVVTVPLGVLRAEAITFSPPLSSERREAMMRIGVGAVEKVALRFPSAFWPEHIHVFGDASGAAGSIPLWLDARRVTSAPVLVGHVAGDAARGLAVLSHAEVIERALAGLRRMFGAAVPAPVAAMTSRWSMDPLARGAFSYAAVGVQPGDRAVLAAPAGRIHFAGEATSSQHWGMVHGAWLSGVREARRIAGGI